MTNKFQIIIEELQSDTFFQQFKFRKKDSAFIKKNNDGFESIEFQHWDGYDLKRDSRALVIKPLYIKRFDVLHKWQDKYSFKSKADQNNNCSIFFGGVFFDKPQEYFFLIDGSDLYSTVEIMKKDIIHNALKFASKFSTLQDIFNFKIIPILDGKKDLPNVGADWVFEYLKLCNIVSPENYEVLKKYILNQVELMNNRGEPNIIEYYPILDNIIQDIETKA